MSASMPTEFKGEVWCKVVKRSELEEEYPSLAKVGTRELAISLVDGEVFATDNICTHAFARLSDGYLEGFELMCPLHGGSFDVRTGEAIGAPCQTPITVYKCRVENGDVFVMIDGGDSSLSGEEPPLSSS